MSNAQFTDSQLWDKAESLGYFDTENEMIATRDGQFFTTANSSLARTHAQTLDPENVETVSLKKNNRPDDGDIQEDIFEITTESIEPLGIEELQAICVAKNFKPKKDWNKLEVEDLKKYMISQVTPTE